MTKALDVRKRLRNTHLDEFREPRTRDEEFRRDSFLTLSSKFVEKQDKAFTKELYCGKMPHKYRSDEAALRAAYRKIDPTKVPEMKSVSIPDRLTNGVTVLEALLADSVMSHGGWAVPSIDVLGNMMKKRSVNADSAKKMVEENKCVREITLDCTDEKELDELISTTEWELARDRANTGMSFISFDVESIHMLRKDVANCAVPGSEGWTRPIETRRPRRGEDKIMVPARIIIGGSDWFYSIRFNIDTVETAEGDLLYTIHRNPLHPKMRKFLANLPVGVGCGVKNDYQDVDDFLKGVLGETFEFPHNWIELGSLGALAGYHSRFSMVNMNLQLVGGLLVKSSSEADGKWALPWNDLSEELKSYLIGDVRAGFNMCVVLFAAAQRQFFPDPEAVCHLTDSDQFTVTTWFFGVLKKLLTRVEIHQDAYFNAKTRTELMMSLRKRRMYYDDDDVGFDDDNADPNSA